MAVVEVKVLVKILSVSKAVSIYYITHRVIRNIRGQTDSAERETFPYPTACLPIIHMVPDAVRIAADEDGRDSVEI